MDNRVRLLILAAEDFTALWDARLELQHERSAEVVARQGLARLADDGLIEFFVGTGPAYIERRLDHGEIAEALRPGPQWATPEDGSDGPFTYFAATDAGVDLIRSLNWGRVTEAR